MLITGPIATARALLDRFGASRIDCEECERAGVFCDCPQVDQQLLSATGCTPNAAARGANDETAVGGGLSSREVT